MRKAPPGHKEGSSRGPRALQFGEAPEVDTTAEQNRTDQTTASRTRIHLATGRYKKLSLGNGSNSMFDKW